MSRLRRLAQVAALGRCSGRSSSRCGATGMTLGMMLGIPAIQLVLFGYAIQTEVRHLPTVVLDESRIVREPALVEVFRNSGNFDIVARGGRPRARSHGRSRPVGPARRWSFRPDFMRDIKRGRTAPRRR